MLVGISGLRSGEALKADLPILVAAELGTSATHGYTFRSPSSEQTGIEVTVFRSPLGVAPELVHYEVTDWWGFETQGPTTGTLDRRQHDLAYLWNMGLPDSNYETARNLLPTWRDANNPIGHKAVALRQQGPATWSVTVIEQHTGKRVTVSGHDNVQPEDASFPSSRTLVVDNTGNGDHLTFDGALAATFGETLPHLILIADEQTHIARETVMTSDYPSLRIRGVTRNGGAVLVQDATQPYKPKPRAFAFTTYDTAKTKQFEIFGLDIVGHWDSTTETLRNGCAAPASFIRISGDDPSYINLIDCSVSGWKSAMLVTETTGRVSGFFGTKITNWQDYGIYEEHHQSIPWSRSAIVNTEVTQHVDALCGGPKLDGPEQWHNNHGPYRTPNGSVMFYASYLFARNGWSAKGINAAHEIDGGTDDSLVWDPNACLRLGQAGARGAATMLRCCTLEGGNAIFSIKGANPGRPDRPMNIIAGQFIAVLGPRTSNLLQLGYSGVTMEGFQAIRTGGKVIDGAFEFAPTLFMVVNETNGGPTNDDVLTERVRLRNYTFLNQRSESERFAEDGKGIATFDGLGSAGDKADFGDFIASNGILHSTNATIRPADTFAPIAEVPLSGFEVSEKGYRDNADDPQPAVLWNGDVPQFVDNSGSPVGSIVLAVPQAGSLAIGGADGQAPDEFAVYDLFKGLMVQSAQSEPADRGALILTP
jgi:hypothetical protein